MTQSASWPPTSTSSGCYRRKTTRTTTTRGNSTNPPNCATPLHAVFPHWNDGDPTANPLNWILPGYETIWRVTLRCFVELNMRCHSEEREWHRVLDAFIAQPTRAQLFATNSADVSAINISKEALRLYPPTRRVYRAFRTSPQSDPTDAHGPGIHAADIETLHRNTILWGPDATLFRPSRWAHLTGAQTKFFLPMGHRPFACPARQETFSGPQGGEKLPFGVSFLALLVGIMSDETQRRSWIGFGVLPATGGPLPSEREALADLFLWNGGKAKVEADQPLEQK